MKKLIALLLAVVMVLGLVACAQPAKPTEAPKDTTAAKPTEGNKDTTAGTTAQTTYFPLKEETVLTFAINTQNATKGLDEMKKHLEANVLLQELQEKTNVKVELTAWTPDTITAMFANDEMGDVVLCGGSGNDNLFNGFVGEGVIAALNDYIDNAEITPNIHATMWAECPEARATFTTPDGNLYVMGTYNMDRKAFVEGMLWVYKPWLDQWAANGGKTEIKDVKDYEAFMKYVCDNDMNGNGKDDEIGVYFGQGVNNGIESFLGMYGLPTKDGTYENYVTLKDGTDEAMFIPQMDEWKDFIKLIGKWWQNGWISEGMFTDTWSNYQYQFNVNKTDTVQCASGYWSNVNNHVDGKNYVIIPPFKLGDADIRWYIHPGYMGSKSTWCVPAASENVELAVRFMDLFYDTDVSIRTFYGEADSPWRTTLADGTFYVNTLSNKLQDQLYFTEDNCLHQVLNLPKPTTAGVLELKQRTEADDKAYAGYDMYKEYLNQTVWPRPYTPADDQTRLTELRTDIFNLVNEKRAEWITGKADIDAEWDQFQEDLETAGIEEFLEIMQGAYDIWFENYSKAAGK